MAPVAPAMPTISFIRQNSRLPTPNSQHWELASWELGVLTGYHRGVLLRRQREGSVLCTSCGVLVGVDDDTCYNCGRRNPGLWGFAPALRALGGDLGFVPFVIGTCAVIYALTLVFSQGQIGMGGFLGFLSPNNLALFTFGASGAIPIFQFDRWWT